MATSSGTSWYTRPYEGGFRINLNYNNGALTSDENGWFNNFTTLRRDGDHDGYCYTPSYSTKGFCFCFKFTDLSNFHAASSLTITIPVVCNGYTKGELYIKVFPGDTSMESADFGDAFKPTSNTNDASASWASSSWITTCEFTVSADKLTNLKNNSYIYVTVGGDKLVQIGSPNYTPANGWWSATLNYETHGYVTANKPSITDNGNNTFTIVGSAGNSAAYNAVKSTTLHYKRGNEEFTQASSLTYSGRINCEASAASQKITAYTAVDGVYNDTTSESREATVLNYVAPGSPGRPYLTDSSFKNGRLTVKQDWGWQWTLATATNKSSPVTGYRIRLYKNGWSIPIKDASGNTLSVDGGEGKAWSVYYDTESTSTSITIDPIKHGIVPGDQVYLGIYAYSKNGNNNQLFSEYITSDTDTVQNAGVVNIKVAGEWVEGQVWIKANNEWKEAETVNVKVNGDWEESQ